MNTKREIIVLGLLATAIMPMWAQQLKGIVIDKKSKETLIGAVITAMPSNGSKAAVEKDGIKAMTDIDGNFVLQNLKDGTYTLYIKYVGYKTQKIDGVQVKDGKRIDDLTIACGQPSQQRLDCKKQEASGRHEALRQPQPPMDARRKNTRPTRRPQLRQRVSHLQRYGEQPLWNLRRSERPPQLSAPFHRPAIQQ